MMSTLHGKPLSTSKVHSMYFLAYLQHNCAITVIDNCKHERFSISIAIRIIDFSCFTIVLIFFSLPIKVFSNWQSLKINTLFFVTQRYVNDWFDHSGV